MKKAKYIGKSYGTGQNRDYVFLEYEYRGYKYEVYENRAKGNEPLSWQHKSQQGYIDNLIEIEEKTKNHKKPDETVEDALDMLFEYWNS